MGAGPFWLVGALAAKLIEHVATPTSRAWTKVSMSRPSTNRRAIGLWRFS